MTVAQLKALIKEKGWSVGSAHLKADLRKVVIDRSYEEEQAAGLAAIANLSM